MEEISVFAHESLVMGCVYSSYTAQKSTILAAKKYDELVKEIQSTGEIPDQTYAPLKKALRRGGLLEHEATGDAEKLEHTVANALYADNVVLLSQDKQSIIKIAVKVTLALNAFSFQLHEGFANDTEVTGMVKAYMDEVGGHLEIHEDMRNLSAKSDETNDTDECSDGTTSKIELDRLPQIGEGNIEGKNYEINFLRQPKIWTQNEYISIENACNIVRILGLQVMFSKCALPHSKCVQSVPPVTMLKDHISFTKFLEIEGIDEGTFTMRALANRLGRIYEPLPGYGFISKILGKCALYLSYKIRKFLLEYRKILLDYVNQGMPQKYKSKCKVTDVSFPESEFILGNSIEQKLKYVRKRFPLLTWDTRYSELVQIMRDTQLLPGNMIKFVSEVTNQIFYFMRMFKQANEKMRFLKIPRKFSNCLCNLTTDPNVSKFILGFSDAAPSTSLDIPFHDATYTNKYECNICFLCGSVYLLHFCKGKNDYVASILTSYNKIASDLPIVKLESLSLENLMPRISHFCDLFQVDLKNNTRIFCDNQIVVFIIQQFSKKISPR